MARRVTFLLAFRLVFFGTGHVGLWLGHGRLIHAPYTGQVVSLARLDTSWYASSYSGAVRVTGSQREDRPDPVLAPKPRGRQRHR